METQLMKLLWKHCDYNVKYKVREMSYDTVASITGHVASVCHLTL